MTTETKTETETKVKVKAKVKAKTLAQKMLLIMKDVAHIPKNGFNSFHKYKYASDTDVTAAFSKAMQKHGVLMLSSILERSSCIYKTRKGYDTFLVTVKLEVTFIDVDSGEKFTSIFYGDGSDSDDKGVYKAITGAQKYALMKTFLVSTGDDPERTINRVPISTNRPKKIIKHPENLKDYSKISSYDERLIPPPDRDTFGPNVRVVHGDTTAPQSFYDSKTQPQANENGDRLMSDKQRKFIYALCGKMGWDRETKLKAISRIVGRGLISTTTLTSKEANLIIDSLK